MGQVYIPSHTGSNKITLEGYNHLTWRYKVIPYIRTDNCIDMSNMFSGANYQLPETLDLRNFNTSKVTTMRSMFDNCMSETILGLDVFNTSKVTDMSFMFNSSKATELDLSHFDTSKVETMENMFCDSSVEQLDISSFDTSKVTNMSNMFKNVEANIDISNFNTSLVTNMHGMFQGTSGTTLDLSHFDTSLVEDIGNIFYNTSYDEIDYSGFDTSNVVNMQNMFRNTSLDEIDVSGFDTSNVEDMSYMFAGTSLQTFVFPNTLDVSNVKDISGLFSNMTVPNLDLRGFHFQLPEAIEPNTSYQKSLFSGLNTNILDISDWDLGANASNAPYGNAEHGTWETLFSYANIHDLRFSNNNTFPEGYNVSGMFNNFITDGTLDLSSFHFYKAIMMFIYPLCIFGNAKIHTLILPDITNNTFDLSVYSNIRIFENTAVELLDWSNAELNINNGNQLFNGLTATRVNMPNKICTDVDVNTKTGKAKYVDYSSVNTLNADYTSDQWAYMANYGLDYTKIVWIPSTFILDSRRTMNITTGEIYTDALNYSELGWNEEPSNVIIHYGTTHNDFEQAIINDDADEWVAPNGSPIFFCHTHVPLGSAYTQYQMMTMSGLNLNEVYLDDELVTEGQVFDTVGTHTLKITVGGYDYKQKIIVEDHGNSYSVVGSPYDYTWNSSSGTYTSTTSTTIQCRLYPDNYLFVYPLNSISNSVTAYTRVESTPSNNIVKISGLPFGLRKFSLQNSSRLTDISEMIVISDPFDPSDMFNMCTSLVNVSVVNKWSIGIHYNYYYKSGSRVNQQWAYYNYSRMFQNTQVITAPKIRISLGSSSVFRNCAALTDISNLDYFNTSPAQGTTNRSLTSLFYGCTSLSNVDRLKVLFTKLKENMGMNPIELSSFLSNTAITNVDFIPDEGLRVKNLESTFSNCSYLTNLSGLARIIWPLSGATFARAFDNIPATDYSSLANWNSMFTEIQMPTTKISNLSFLSNWDLSACIYYSFEGCTLLSSISVLSGKISTTKQVEVNLKNCTALTSLSGLEGCKFSTSTSFNGCSALINLDGLDGCTIKNGTSLFANCSSLTDVSGLANTTFTSSNINYMFQGCSSLTSLNGLQVIDISGMNQLASVFYGCTSLTDLSAISGWNPYQVTNVSNLFYNCNSITSFSALQNWITAQLTNISNAFYGCSSLINLNGLAGFNVARCSSLAYLFYGCTALVDISAIEYWYVANCTNMSDMFQGCSSLLSVDPIKNWNIQSLTNMVYMFHGCSSITDAAVLDNWSSIKTMTSVNRNYAFYNVPTPWPTWAVS